MRFTVTAACGLAALAVAACGSDDEKKADTKKEDTVEATTTVTEQTTETDTTTVPSESFSLPTFESQLANELNGELDGAQAGGVTADVTEVQCPDSTAPSAGQGPECDVSGDGDLTGDVQVTFEDNTGQSYSYTGSVTVGGNQQSVSGTVGGNSNN